MGAQEFIVEVSGQTAHEAFLRACEDAHYEHGHRGYTGTIAEKNGFRMVPPPTDGDCRAAARAALNDCDHWSQDKWGPAGCIQSGPQEWIFFGWSPS